MIYYYIFLRLPSKYVQEPKIIQHTSCVDLLVIVGKYIYYDIKIIREKAERNLPRYVVLMIFSVKSTHIALM